MALRTNASGADATAYELLNRGKKHDYFTSALPWPQKGADVTIPLGTTASVVTNNQTPNIDQPNSATPLNNSLFQASSSVIETNSGALAGGAFTWGNETGMQADLTDATAATINQLRLAFATQKFLEIQARGGSRYIEVIKNHFNVTSPDARLQRPEYLGGGSSPVNISPVAQTSSTDA